MVIVQGWNIASGCMFSSKVGVSLLAARSHAFFRLTYRQITATTVGSQMKTAAAGLYLTEHLHAPAKT
jgi:hypothetical protein